MRRRSILIGLVVAPLVRPARAAEQRRISILHSGFPNRTPIARLYAALRELGYEDQRTASIDLLGGEGDLDRLKKLVKQIAEGKPDVTIALTSPAVRALKAAGVTTPVVFAFVPDPVGQGLVASLVHPGGNFTGITYSDPTLGGKRLDLLLDALPGMQRVAVIWGRGLSEAGAIVDAIRLAAQARGVAVFSRELAGVEDLVPAFAEAGASGAQALVVISDNVMFGHRKEIAELALSHHLPSMHSFSPEVEDGGLMSYGPELEESYRRAAERADRILRGRSPADLPMEEPTRFAFVINLKTANALGLTLPPALLARADEVIE
jgi:putative tryptophan/tyrosine transport system substrate-binding protein